MAKKKKNEVEETQPEAEAASPAEKPVKKSDAVEAVVMNGARPVRTYSLAVHGEEFAALADEYASSRKLAVVLK